MVTILTKYVLTILARFSASLESNNDSNRLNNTYVYLTQVYETQNDFLTITNLIIPDIVIGENVNLTNSVENH